MLVSECGNAFSWWRRKRVAFKLKISAGYRHIGIRDPDADHAVYLFCRILSPHYEALYGLQHSLLPCAASVLTQVILLFLRRFFRRWSS